MPSITLSASRLRKQVETKAYAYGVSSSVSTLLGEYVVDLLRQASRHLERPVTDRSSVIH